jgi:beta-aspartyl-peptidase (threonine type)
MKNALFFVVILALTLVSCENTSDTNDETTSADETATTQRAEYAIVIHGGAGTIRRADMTPERDSAYRAALNAALDIGEAILKSGGSSMDAVEQTIISLENSPLFNAGKGAVFTNDGENELDAAFMTGADLNAGAVGGLTNIKNPIRAARAVLEQSEHVFLIGKGAEAFAEMQGIETVEPSYFYTERRWNALQRAKDAEDQSMGMNSNPDHKFGTVGCVALDKDGNITAGTSTGGMTNKRWDRVGDVPIIGAGTYANNATCGISCTGHGEYFIRYTVAHDVSALMEYKGLSLEEAGKLVINEKLVEAGGSGGLIAVDKYGNVSMPFNSEGMYRGYAKPGERVVGIYDDER